MEYLCLIATKYALLLGHQISKGKGIFVVAVYAYTLLFHNILE